MFRFRGKLKSGQGFTGSSNADTLPDAMADVARIIGKSLDGGEGQVTQVFLKRDVGASAIRLSQPRKAKTEKTATKTAKK